MFLTRITVRKVVCSPKLPDAALQEGFNEKAALRFSRSPIAGIIVFTYQTNNFEKS